MKKIEKTKEELAIEIEQLKDKISMLENAAYKRDASFKALVNSEERLKQILKNSNHWIWEVDPNGMYTYTNDVLSDQLGYLESELVGKKYFYDFFHPNDREKLREEALHRFKQKKPFYNFVNLNLNKYGEEVWLSTSGVPFLDEAGELLGYRGVDIDITQKINSDKKLRESEERYRLIFQNNWDGILTIDPLTRQIVDFNDGASTMMGYSREEFTGLQLENLVAPDSLSSIEKYTNELLNFNKSTFETKHIKKDGSIAYRDVRAEIFEFQGKKLILAIFQDITERKKSEQAILDSKNQLNLIIDKVPGRIAYINSSEQFLHVNKAYAEYYSFSQDSFIGKKVNQVLPDYRYKKIKKDIQSVLEGKEVVRENINLDRNNKEKITLAKHIPHFDEHGNVIAFLTTLEDITERKQAESALAEAYKIINRSPTVAFLWRAVDGWPVDYVSENVEKLFGYTAQEFTKGKFNYRDIIHNEDVHRVNNEVVENSGKKDIVSFSHEPYRILTKTGGTKWVEDVTYIREDTNGKVSHFEGIVYDVTDRKAYEKDLIVALEKATESDRLKSAFLANMSHEIRTPMNGILGFANLLKTPGLQRDEINEYVGIIESSGNRMLNTINDLVDIAKIESGQIEIVNTKFDIIYLLDELYTFFNPAAESKNISLVLKRSISDKNLYIHSDRQKVYSILSNLLNNAIKYTNSGFIEFGFTLSEKSGPLHKGSELTIKEEKNIEFFVFDTGVGIACDQHQKVFERFVQAKNESKSINEGSGLGLSISKAFTELLDGEINLTSEVGVGSKFYFTIPLIDKNKAMINDEKLILDDKKLKDLKKLKILIVDDEYEGRDLLFRVLSNLSNEIILAENGQEAIDKFEVNPGIDLILMDINMPVLDGFSATMNIRKINKNVVIIAQTGDVQPDEKQKALQAGCNDFICKPIEINSLISKINLLLN